MKLNKDGDNNSWVRYAIREKRERLIKSEGDGRIEVKIESKLNEYKDKGWYITDYDLDINIDEDGYCQYMGDDTEIEYKILRVLFERKKEESNEVEKLDELDRIINDVNKNNFPIYIYSFDEKEDRVIVHFVYIRAYKVWMDKHPFNLSI